MKKKPKSARSVRFEASDLELAQKLDLDLSQIAREALKLAILKASGKCLYCHRYLSSNETPSV